MIVVIAIIAAAVVLVIIFIIVIIVNIVIIIAVSVSSVQDIIKGQIVIVVRVTGDAVLLVSINSRLFHNSRVFVVK